MLIEISNHITKPITGVVQVGAHTGGELEYISTLSSNVLLFEPQKDVYEQLIKKLKPGMIAENIALGIHAGDHAIYPDCRQEFRDADDAAFRLGNWGAEKVGYFTPYLEGDKFTILQDGEKLCQKLGLNFDEVYSRTNTSYKPIKSDDKWYSDFKSASSVERVEAFIKLGRPDPVDYAYVNDKGEVIPVSWHYVVSATRVEPPLHPEGPEKITRNYGMLFDPY